MARCDTCGNDYQTSFNVTTGERTFTFDCLECAIHRLAPVCEGCGCRILGHGVQADDRMFCSAHCARAAGISGLQTHIWKAAPGRPQAPRTA